MFADIPRYPKGIYKPRHRQFSHTDHQTLEGHARLMKGHELPLNKLDHPIKCSASSDAGERVLAMALGRGSSVFYDAKSQQSGADVNHLPAAIKPHVYTGVAGQDDDDTFEA